MKTIHHNQFPTQGATNLVDTAAACCAQCAALPGCNVWVWCGDAMRCPAALHRSCWLKKQPLALGEAPAIRDQARVVKTPLAHPAPAAVLPISAFSPARRRRVQPARGRPASSNPLSWRTRRRGPRCCRLARRTWTRQRRPGCRRRTARAPATRCGRGKRLCEWGRERGSTAGRLAGRLPAPKQVHGAEYAGDVVKYGGTNLVDSPQECCAQARGGWGGGDSCITRGSNHSCPSPCRTAPPAPALQPPAARRSAAT